MFDFVISILIALVFLVMLLLMLKNRRVFIVKSSFLLIPMLVIMFAIYFYGMEYENDVQHYFSSFTLSFNALAFRDNFKVFTEANRANLHFVLNYYLNLIMIGFMSFSTIISLFFKQAVNFVKGFFRPKNEVIIITEPNDEDALALLNDKTKKTVVLSKHNKDYEKILLDKNITFLTGLTNKTFKKVDKKGNRFISLLKDPDSLNIVLEMFKQNNKEIYIEADFNLETLIEDDILNHSNVSIFNKAKLISYDFTLNNPISSFLDANYIDPNTALLAKEKEINVFMLGFDAISKSIYLDLVKNNQFIKNINGNLKTYPLNYYIYTNDFSNTIDLNDKLRSFNYDEDKYYAPMEKSYKTTVKQIDYSLYSSIESLLDYNSFNVFILNMGSTFINLSYAKKLAKLNNNKNSLVFLRDKDGKLEATNNLIPFGNEAKIISIDNILNENLFDLAKKRAALYAKSSNPLENWRSLNRDKRLSNIDCILSITHKLGLLGLRIAKAEKGISKDEYFSIYDNNQEIERKEGKIVYPMRFKDTLNNRNVLAMLEHNRWNVEMLLKGYLPMPRNLLAFDSKNRKLIKDDSKLKLHSCLTSFSGLDSYYEEASHVLMENLHISYNEAYMQVENKKYDYELMDNVYDLIQNIGFKIVKIRG